MDALLLSFSLCFAKALGMIVFLPFEIFAQGFGLRCILSVLIGLLGMMQVQINNYELNLMTLPIEFLIGTLISFPIVLLLQAADLWGDLFESLRGQTTGSIADPLFHGETSQLALLTKSLMWVGLVSFGILEHFLLCYLSSFHIFSLKVDYWQKSLLLFSFILNGAIKFIIPFAILCLVIEVTALFASKIITNVSFCTETYCAKFLLGGLCLLSLLESEPLTVFRNIVMSMSVF